MGVGIRILSMDLQKGVDNMAVDLSTIFSIYYDCCLGHTFSTICLPDDARRVGQCKLTWNESQL